MADLRGFDANNVEPAGDFEPIPTGRYEAVIIQSAMKATKAGTGKFLELVFEVTEGLYAKRRLWSRLNLLNPNETAKRLAEADLSAICRAVGVLNPNDSADLHDLPLMIYVRCKKRDDTAEIVNEVKGYAKKDSPPPAGAPTDATPPWKRP